MRHRLALVVQHRRVATLPRIGDQMSPLWTCRRSRHSPSVQKVERLCAFHSPSMVAGWSEVILNPRGGCRRRSSRRRVRRPHRDVAGVLVVERASARDVAVHVRCCGDESPVPRQEVLLPVHLASFLNCPAPCPSSSACWYRSPDQPFVNVELLPAGIEWKMSTESLLASILRGCRCH